MTEATASTGTETPVASEAPVVDVKGLLEFDPFAPPKEEPAASGDGATSSTGTASAEVKGGAAPAKKANGGDATVDPTKAAAAVPPTPATPVVPSKTPEQLLAEHTAAITSAIQEGMKPQAPKGTAGDAEPPKFNLAIPPQLVDAMASEDPKERMTATHALINGVANAVWREAQAMVQSTIGELTQNLPRFMEGHLSAREQQQNIYKDFYGTHKAFDNPQFVPLVQAAGMQEAQARQAQGKPVQWDAEFRDAVAERMYQQFPMLRPQAAPSPAPAKKPAFATGNGGGVRPAPEGGPETDMAALLKF